eukprot:868271-Pleurochrysis_carterae.AAC.3
MQVGDMRGTVPKPRSDHCVCVSGHKLILRCANACARLIMRGRVVSAVSACKMPFVFRREQDGFSDVLSLTTSRPELTSERAPAFIIPSCSTPTS